MKLKTLVLLAIFLPIIAQPKLLLAAPTLAKPTLAKPTLAKPTLAKPRLAISSWEEETNLNSTGKSSEILVRGKVQDFLPNQVMTSFSIGFDQTRQIKITRVICDGVNANYTFKNNTLTLKFLTPKPNNQKVVFYFAFEETYKKINQFLRQEAITIPSFAAEANAEVIINFPNSLESATLNPKITKNGNSFIYKNLVPQNGVAEIIKLTEAQNIWDVAIKANVISNKPLKEITLALPLYFQNGGQRVENFATKLSQTPFEQKTQNKQKIFKFKNIGNQISTQNLARVYVGQNHRIPINRNPQDYLNLTSQNADLLTPILQQIYQNPKYKNLPLYAKIGQFVYEFIKYDRAYIGKLPSLQNILKNQVGVCTEYANLYNSLARLAQIPSFVAHGGACGEYEKCEGHAWNVIYINGKWIEVDPTWNLMSGIVSSSHVYFDDNQKAGIEIEYLDDNQKVESKVDFEMKKVL